VLKSLGSSWNSCLRGSSTLETSSSVLILDRLSKLRESRDLLRERFLEFLFGELENNDFFCKNPSKLLSLVPLIVLLVDLI